MDTRRLRLAIDQMAPVLGDIKANLTEHREAIAWAKREKANLLVFPELSLTGYQVRSMVARVAMAPNDPRLAKLAKDAGSLGVILGFVEKAADGQLFNSAAYCNDGAVRTVQRKMFLPNYGMFDERRFFASGSRIEPFDTPWGRMGMVICFDLLHPALAYLHQQAGVRILVGISAAPARGVGPDGFMAGAEGFRVALRANSRLLGMVSVYANRVGTEEGMVYWGGSEVLDPFGRSLCALPEYEPARAICEIDPEAVGRARTLFPHLKEGRPDCILQEMWRIRMAAPGGVPGAPGTEV
ncbi:MAG: nitrilase-related carbon-nitrogen hydrolase [Candidatus Zixiibacteriota bacterium]